MSVTEKGIITARQEIIDSVKDGCMSPNTGRVLNNIINNKIPIIREAGLNYEELKLFQNKLGELKNKVDEKDC